VTEIHRYWQVMNSKLLERKTAKHEIQMLNCDEDWKLTRTGWAQRPCGFVMLQLRSDRYGERPVCKALKIKVARLAVYTPFSRKPMKIPLRLIWYICYAFFYFALSILINRRGIFELYSVVSVRQICVRKRSHA